MEFESYIKQFWVGLLEGDGSISVGRRGPKWISVRFTINLKNIRENVIMLLIIQEVIGGTVKIYSKSDFVTWNAVSKDLIQFLINILNEYPLLTTRKQCQLKFAIDCIENGTQDYVRKNKELLYKNQQDMLNYNENNFVIPSYFPGWLSGFVEAEGSFVIEPGRNEKSISGRFKIGQNFEQYIIKSIRDFFNSKAQIQVIIAKKKFTKKRELLGEVPLYYVAVGKEGREAIFSHFSKYPLIGYKLVSYSHWYTYLNNN